MTPARRETAGRRSSSRSEPCSGSLCRPSVNRRPDQRPRWSSNASSNTDRPNRTTLALTQLNNPARADRTDAIGRLQHWALLSLNPRVRGRPSPGAGVSALHGSRQGFQDPLAASSRLARRSRPSEPRHGQSILEVLRTGPLTAPAPGSDRRLPGEGHQVGGHRHRSDHEPNGSLPGMSRWWLGARTGMHLRREQAHLHTRELHRVHGQRRARCVPDRKVIGGQSRSPIGRANWPRPAARQVNIFLEAFLPEIKVAYREARQSKAWRDLNGRG